MDFRKAKARQPEILRSIQKDNEYTKELSENLSDLLRLTGSRNWIKYNHLCLLVAQISYHGFASLNNLQTLGEEYTGIIQLDSQYKHIPSRLLQLTAILLQFGGETFYRKLLEKVEKLIMNNEDIKPEAKHKLKTLLQIMHKSPAFIQALHKSIFYYRSDSYQISKRITGIKYILIRHWLQPQFSLYGYKILGFITGLQFILQLLVSAYEYWKGQENEKEQNTKYENVSKEKCSILNGPQCILCLENRQNTSLTPCGHLFCWYCILNWLDESNQCPLCREPLKKSRVIQLKNYY